MIRLIRLWLERHARERRLRELSAEIDAGIKRQRIAREIRAQAAHRGRAKA